MNKFYVALALSLVLFAGFACTIPANRPEKVAQAFLVHLSVNEYEEAILLSTPETADILRIWQQEGLNNYEGAAIVITGHELISDSVAVCTYTADGIVGQLHLKKIDGKWKAQMEK